MGLWKRKKLASPSALRVSPKFVQLVLGQGMDVAQLAKDGQSSALDSLALCKLKNQTRWHTL